MWKRSSRKRELTCQQVKAQLLAYLDGKLGPTRQQAIRAHLAVCEACAQSTREIEDMEARLFTAAARHRPRLSPQASARIQERVYRRMRVALVVRRTMGWAGSAVGLIIVLALALRLLALWQGEAATSSTSVERLPHTLTPVTPTPVERLLPTLPPSTPAPTAPPPYPPTPVRSLSDAEVVFVPFGATELTVYRSLAQQFQQAHPDLSVVIQEPNYSAGSGLVEKAAQGDCFAYYPNLDSQEERAAVLNLEPFIAADPGLDLADLNFVDSFRYQGQTLGLPVQGFPKVIAYNKALFDAAGVAYPSPDWTLDDFVRTALALTQGQGETFGFVSGSSETTDLMFFLEQQGAPLVNENSDPLDFLFDAPATRAAVQWYADLGRVYGVKPTFKADWSVRSTRAYTERQALIGQGRAAMWISYAGSGTDPFAKEVETGIVPLPQGAGQVGDYLLDGYFISARAGNPQACWEWIKFLSTQTGQLTGVPARRALAESRAYRQQVGEERAAALLGASTNAKRLISFRLYGMSGWTSEPFRWLAQAFDAVVEGEMGVDAALALAQQKAQRYRACLVARDGLADRVAWEACAAEAEQALEP